MLARVPAVVLLPQCRPGSYWSDPLMEEMVAGALEQTAAEFGADPARFYLAGVSMGGYGVWSLASRYGRKFAALVSICGGSPLSSGERFRAVARSIGPVPSWLFHGAEDRVVPVTESRAMAEAMRENGGEVRYDEYPGVGHDVWTRVLAEKELLPWLLSKRL
jgi:predicted peptidase